MNDLRLAFRSWRRTPLVSAVAVASLALAIGTNTAVFAVFNSLLLRRLPVSHPDRLVTVSSDAAIQLGFTAGVGWSYPMWDRLRARASAFEGAAAWSVQRFNLAMSGESDVVPGLAASGSFFQTVGLRPVTGRAFSEADDRRGGGPEGPVAVISDRLWKRRFGADVHAIGSSLPIDGVPFTIVGVLPPEFYGIEIGRPVDVILPIGAEWLVHGDHSILDDRRALLLIVMLRLRPDQSIAEATQAARELAPDIFASDPLPPFAKAPFVLFPASRGTSSAEPGTAGLRAQQGGALVTVLTLVIIVLVVACANLANLQLARTIDRRHDWQVRLALGAGPARLVRQVLVESAVLTTVSAALGLVLAQTGSWALMTMLSTRRTPVFFDRSLDWRVLLFTLAIAGGSALLFGLGAAWRVGKSRTFAMRTGGRHANTGGWFARSIVTAQIALSLVLIVAAGLFVGTLFRLSRLPLGYDVDRVVVVDVDTARARSNEPSASLIDRLAAAMRGVPQVERVAVSRFTPTRGGIIIGFGGPGGPANPSRLESRALENVISPGWFLTYGTPILAGRDFSTADDRSAPAVTVVNETLARRLRAQGDPIGQTVEGRAVIGVVADQVVQGGYKTDGTQRTVRDGAPPTMYVPLAQSAALDLPETGVVTISLRTRAAAALLTPRVREAIADVHPALTFTIGPLSDEVSAGLKQERLLGSLSALLGGAALILASVGVYGMAAYAVRRRRKELTVRMALGAGPAAIRGLVVSSALTQVIAGIGLGALASFWLVRLASPLVFGVEPRDPLTFAIAAVVLCLITLGASLIPAMRAARISLAEVLKQS